MTIPTDDRPPMVVAMQWTSRITSLCLEMVLPGAAGYWLDGRLGTKILFLVLGIIAGFVTGLWQLIQWTQPDANGAASRVGRGTSPTRGRKDDKDTKDSKDK